MKSNIYALFGEKARASGRIGHLGGAVGGRYFLPAGFSVMLTPLAQDPMRWMLASRLRYTLF